MTWRFRSLHLSADRETLVNYVQKQLAAFFPDATCVTVEPYIDETLERVERCFRAINYHYFQRDDGPYFDHLHSDHYAMFLYLLSNTMFHNGAERRDCQKLFNLNKALHAIDVLFDVQLPSIFLFIHSVGTVLGKATYSDYLMVSQHCSVGANRRVYPVLGKYLAMRSGASIIGSCTIGDNCQIGAGSIIMDRDLGPNEIYSGTPLKHEIRANKKQATVWFPPLKGRAGS
jgi:serine O-acetyltransferase